MSYQPEQLSSSRPKFKTDDWFIIDPWSEAWQVTRVSGGRIFCTYKGSEYVYSADLARHATTEEIAAGKKLLGESAEPETVEMSVVKDMLKAMIAHATDRVLFASDIKAYAAKHNIKLK